MASYLKGNGSTSQWRRLRSQILKRDAYTCFYCGGEATTVDHIVPRSKLIDQNADTPDNLVAACAKCNYSKGGRFFDKPPTPSTPLDSFTSQTDTIVHYGDESGSVDRNEEAS